MADRPVGKEEERGKIPYFTTIALDKLVEECDKAQIAKKYMYIADMSGQASTFFTYQAKWEIFSWHGEVKKAIIKKEQTKKEAAEKFRKQVYNALFYGRQCVMNFDTMIPSMKKDYDIPGTLPLKDMIFHREKLLADLSGPKTLLRTEEDVDKDGNKGNFHPKTEEYNMICMSNMSDPDCDDEIIQMALDQIEHIEDWHCVYILPQD